MKKNKVLVGGCFDILHIGHIKFLKAAKKLGNYLVVALEPDEKVNKLKGEKRPINNQITRSESLLALKAVDEVINLKFLSSDEDYNNLVLKVKPNIIAATSEDPIIKKKAFQAKLVGAELTILPKFKSKSTSDIIQLLNENN